MREKAAKEALEALASLSSCDLKMEKRNTLSSTKLQRQKTNVEKEFDSLLKLYGMPEHRQHFAAHAPSGALRQHILKTNPNRSCGGDALGSVSDPTRNTARTNIFRFAIKLENVKIICKIINFCGNEL